MASYHLIDAYLERLRGQMRWHGDAAAIDVELRDHLQSAAERLKDGGVDHEDAQRDVLARFGEASNVALSFASAGKRGIAVPTTFTRKSGTVALVGAVVWLVVMSGFGLAWIFEEQSGTWERRSQTAWSVGSIGLLCSVVATALLIAALDRRHGGLGLLGRVGIGLAALAAITSIVSWLFVVWGFLIGLSAILVSTAIVRRGIAPIGPTAIFGATPLISFLAFAVLRGLEVGTADRWGDYAIADRTAVVVGCMGFAAGMFGLGRWLRSEAPVDPADLSLLVTA
jgi:hypothetical protein